MPFPQNSKKFKPMKNRKMQINNMQQKRDSEELEYQMEGGDKKDFKDVEIANSGSDLVNLGSEKKSKKLATKCKSNELKQKFALDAGHIKKENKNDFQTLDEDSNICAKKIKKENNSDSEQEFTTIVPTSKTEFAISWQDDTVNATNAIKIEVNSDSEDTPLQEIKKEIDGLNSIKQIKIEKDITTDNKSNISTIPNVDHISVGEIKIEDGVCKANTASEDEYSDNEMQLVDENYTEFNSEYGGDGKMESSDEDDIPSTSRRAQLPKSKAAKVKLPVKLKEETNNESDSDLEDSQIPSDEGEEFLSTEGSGGEEFLSESEEENSDNESLTLENKDVVIQLIDEYHKRPQLWFEDLPTELNVFKETQLYRGIKDNLNKKFSKKFTAKHIKMLVKLMLEQYEKEIERQLQANEETVAESSTLWFYDKLNFVKDDIENKVKLKLESSIKLLDDNILAEFIEIYKNYNCLWDRNNPSFPYQKKRRETLLSMCLEIKNKLNISLNSFSLQYQLTNLHKNVENEKTKRFKNESIKRKYIPVFRLIDKCDFLENHQKPFKCDECMEFCATYNKFRQHKAQHDGTLPFKCHVCGLVCKNGPAFEYHSYLHNFFHPTNLKKHVVGVHLASLEGNVFNCEVCGKTFDHLRKLAEHKLKMHEQ